MAGPSYQNRTAPELCPPPVHVRRTDGRNVRTDPGFTTMFALASASVTLCSTALLKPELPADTFSTSPDPTSVPFTNTSARTSRRSPTASLFFSPIQTFALPSPSTSITVTVDDVVLVRPRESVTVSCTVNTPACVHVCDTFTPLP